MLNLKTLPNDVAVELLLYLAENENFSSVQELAPGVSVDETKNLLREIALSISRADVVASSFDSTALSSGTRKVISKLNKDEREVLFQAFTVK